MAGLIGKKLGMTQVYSDGPARFTVFNQPLGEKRLADNLVAQLGPT